MTVYLFRVLILAATTVPPIFHDGGQTVISVLKQLAPVVPFAVGVTASALVVLFGMYLIFSADFARTRFATMVDHAPSDDRRALIDSALARYGKSVLWRQLLADLQEKYDLEPQDDPTFKAPTPPSATAGSEDALQYIRRRDEYVSKHPDSLLINKPVAEN